MFAAFLLEVPIPTYWHSCLKPIFYQPGLWKFGWDKLLKAMAGWGYQTPAQAAALAPVLAPGGRPDYGQAEVSASLYLRGGVGPPT